MFSSFIFLEIRKRFFGFVTFRKNRSNSVLVFDGALKFGFYRVFPWVISHISAFSLATSVFIGFLQTWLKTFEDIREQSNNRNFCQREFWGVFVICRFRKYFISGYFSVILDRYRKHEKHRYNETNATFCFFYITASNKVTILTKTTKAQDRECVPRGGAVPSITNLVFSYTHNDLQNSDCDVWTPPVAYKNRSGCEVRPSI